MGHVTNGVHVSSWDSPESDRLWTEACGKERWREGLQSIGEAMLKVSAADLWEMRSRNRQRLIAWIREQHALNQPATNLLNPNALTFGFARRFATYKRPNLLLKDKQRLAHLLTSTDNPVQLVIAGKAHPRDLDGQEHDADTAWDSHEADCLYDLLEQQVIPEFYRRNAHGIPEDWIGHMRNSMAKLTPVYSSNRMIRQYAEEYYLPMARTVRRRCTGNLAEAKAITAWKVTLEQHWPSIHFGNLKTASDESSYYFGSS